MKNLKLLIFGLNILAGLASTAFCATNGVVLGQSFQSVINASAPGDTLIVQPGVYPDASLNFDIPLTVLPSGTNGNPIQFMGTIQVTSSGANSFQQAYFGTNVQTVGSTVSFFDSYFNGPVTASGGKLTIKRTTFNTNAPLTLVSNASLEALRMTNFANASGNVVFSPAINATATPKSGASFLAVQSTFNSIVNLSGYSVWLGYNTFSTPSYVSNPSDLQQTNCDSVLIGNVFSSGTSVQNSSYGIVYSEGGTLKAYNNRIIAFHDGNPNFTVYGLLLRSNVVDVVNNTISLYTDGYKCAMRAVSASDGGPITLRGNILSTATSPASNGSNNNLADVEAYGSASQAIFLSYCDLWFAGPGSASGSYAIGIAPLLVSCLQGDPKLAATPPTINVSLLTGSPCINAGPPDAIYNNRDGTQNTIGYTGGPYWNPANYTNNNPMVFLLTGQQMVVSGAQTNIQVNVGASAGQ